MKKRIMALLLAGLLAGFYELPVAATESTEQTSGEGTDDEAAAEADGAAAEDEGAEADGAAAEDEGAEADGAAADAGDSADTTAEIVIPKGNMVDVDVIDLALHAETTGDRMPVYAYENPFRGKDTSKGAVIEFYAKPTWDVHVLGTIFAINGSGAYDGKLYFTPGSYLGFNSEGFGGFYDANLFNYNIVTDYIKDGAMIRIELLPDGFAVYADDVLCYDQTILDNPQAADGDFTPSSDFSGVLTWLSGAEALYFGYGSWWNTVSDIANIELSRVSFRLADGTVLMDRLQADKDLVESLGGSVAAVAADTQTELKLADVDVEIFDMNSVAYQGSSVLPLMLAVVVIVALGALVTIVLVCRPRTYE
ncbi:MAG: hypothetical protein K2L86_07975 [Lachnospiraceae bacterium]|nr:hypothetical protein [Lachnospiraceae bacterium]